MNKSVHIYCKNRVFCSTCWSINQTNVLPKYSSNQPIYSLLQDAFKGRENPLSGLNPQSFTRGELEVGIAEELRVQFSVSTDR